MFMSSTPGPRPSFPAYLVPLGTVVKGYQSTLLITAYLWSPAEGTWYGTSRQWVPMALIKTLRQFHQHIDRADMTQEPWTLKNVQRARRRDEHFVVTSTEVSGHAW